jgi:hypothetical protein
MQTPPPQLILITPSARATNLKKVAASIRWPYVKHWYIVYDGRKPPPELQFSSNPKISEYIVTDKNSTAGNAQRNYVLDRFSQDPTLCADSYVYFLDDDNVIHPKLYELLDRIRPGHLYTFNQLRPPSVFPYVDLLQGNCVQVKKIDTAMYLIWGSMIGQHRWIHDRYDADGYFITAIFEENKDRWIWVDECMAYYNALTQ